MSGLTARDDYRDFEDTLMPRPTFDQIKAAGPLSLAVEMDGASHLRGWRDLLGERMHDVAALALAVACCPMSI